MAAALATDDVSLELRDDKTREDVDLMADLTSAREEETVTGIQIVFVCCSFGSRCCSSALRMRQRTFD